MFLDDKRILVTGSQGFIGGALLERLRAEGYKVRAWAHDDGDLTIPLYCDLACEDVDVIFHFAATTAGAGVVVNNPMALVHTNLVMFANLINVASKSGVKKFIFPSSTTGYPDTAEPMREDDYFKFEPFAGYRPIGLTKRYLEQLASMYAMDTVALRTTNVYGPGDCFDPLRSHVIPATIRKVAERQDPLIVWGDGNDVRDAIYIDDMVEACLTCSELTGHEAINFGLGKGYSVREMLSILCEHEKFNPQVIYDDTKPQLLKKRLVVLDKAKSLGWEAKVSMEDGLIKTLKWYSKQ